MNPGKELDNQRQGNEKNLPKFETEPPPEFWTWWAAEPSDNGYTTWPIKPTLVVPKSSVNKELQAKFDLLLSDFKATADCAQAGFKCDYTVNGAEGCPCQWAMARDPDFGKDAHNELRRKAKEMLDGVVELASGLPEGNFMDEWAKEFLAKKGAK